MMLSKLEYLTFQVQRKILRNHMPKHTSYGNKINDIDEGNRIIFDLLNSEKPCMIARIGSVEMQAINAVLNKKFGLRTEIPQVVLETLYNNAGFFPKSIDGIESFFSLYCERANNVDAVAFLMNRDEDYFFHKYSRPKAYMTLNALEPYYSENPWSKALECKKVLVINPFAETIKRQYKNREKIFKNENVLPQFDLQTFKSVQSIAGATEGYNTWFSALDDMKNKIINFDFDIAILGCGAYAFPLASYIKDMGKQAIVMGGANQILFGIKGARWDNHPRISKLYNEFWVRPDKNETPLNAFKVEGGCYW